MAVGAPVAIRKALVHIIRSFNYIAIAQRRGAVKYRAVAIIAGGQLARIVPVGLLRTVP